MGTAMSGINANQANTIKGINMAEESLRNTNLAIQNREAIINSRIGMMNTGLKNKFLSDKLGRKLAIRRGLAQVSSNVGSKAQGLYAEKDLKMRDQMAFETIVAGDTSGSTDRNLSQLVSKWNKRRRVTRNKK